MHTLIVRHIADNRFRTQGARLELIFAFPSRNVFEPGPFCSFCYLGDNPGGAVCAEASPHWGAALP